MDQPECLCQFSWVPSHILAACHVVAWATPGKGGAAKVTAESEIKHKSHVCEMFLGANTIRKAKIREWPAPQAGIELAPFCNICWLSATRPEPSLNVMAMIWIPFTCKSTTSLIVEGPAHGCFWAELGTTLIMPFILGIDVAVLGRLT